MQTCFSLGAIDREPMRSPSSPGPCNLFFRTRHRPVPVLSRQNRLFPTRKPRCTGDPHVKPPEPAEVLKEGEHEQLFESGACCKKPVMCSLERASQHAWMKRHLVASLLCHLEQQNALSLQFQNLCGGCAQDKLAFQSDAKNRSRCSGHSGRCRRLRHPEPRQSFHADKQVAPYWPEAKRKEFKTMPGLQAGPLRE